MNTVELYRLAAMELFGASAYEANIYIVAPEDDPGEWAPNALAIIYLEFRGGNKEDKGKIPSALKDYDNALKCGQRAGIGYIEHINAAVAAVWPA